MCFEIGLLLLLAFVLCYKCENVSDRLVQYGFVKLTALKSIHDPLTADRGITRHFKIKPCAEHVQAVVRCAPVGHHKPVKAPLAAQNLIQKPCILTAIRAVDFVISTHHRFGMCILDDHFKGLQIYLANSTHIGNAIAHKAIVFAVVECKVFNRYPNALTLNTARLGSPHFSRKVRVLRKILKASAAQRISFDIDRRAEHNVHAVVLCFLADSLSHSICVFGVPA